MARLYRNSRGRRGLLEALRIDEVNAICEAAGRPLLVAAQHHRRVRDDLTLEQILDMIIAVARIHGETRYLEPILQTALDGLRPPTLNEPCR